MKKILVTGGTTFVSKYTAGYFAKNNDVYVLNRNSRPQVPGVTLIEGDRHDLGGRLKGLHFDAVLDITSYDAEDITDLCDGLDSFDDYIMISTSAVYSLEGSQPFVEEAALGRNPYWGPYSTGKIAAEKALLARVPDAYILRPPYIYGPMNSLYREPFVFDCARADRKFYLPGDGSQKLQFFYIGDLCGVMEAILEQHPSEHIFNVGNEESISVREWVEMCYACYGKTPAFVNVSKEVDQTSYFSFYPYEYRLDIQKQKRIYPELVPMPEGLAAAAEWYDGHEEEVRRKEYIAYIDENLAR